MAQPWGSAAQTPSLRKLAFSPAMPSFTLSVHPRGLHPLQAAHAWHLHKQEGLPLRAVRDEVTNVMGETPSVKAVWTAVQAVERSKEGDRVPRTRYANCGRRPKLTDVQQKAVVDFVRQWRNKRFCTCRYIRAALKIQATKRTIANVLNRHGFFWRAIPKVRGLSDEGLKKRQAFVDAYSDERQSWWQDHGSVRNNLLQSFVLKTRLPS